ncbi:DNA-directed RNA polymerase [Actinidia chinensis var. chinensis]|uniref:DNA-directed RNA polymerase n=1 Tax=Actinidia chinensis var. chinensis TaxID=1590841 RepID=A0A2R6PFH5_ACTCC|nr:DNA-directed RNA polymerase [Actinidia chinensis var. chinensis]
MGNAISPCFHPSSRSFVKLIFWEGTTRVLTEKMLAGEIMFEFPDRMVCHADSFFIGHPIPALAIEDELKTGQTYFVLPLDCITSNVLSASSLAALGSSSPNRSLVNFKECPFEYIKGSNGRVSIKVMPEFIIKLLTRGKELTDHESKSPSHDFICSTPELKRHYDQLVGSREQVWSPQLKTISEYKIRFSPCRFIGLEWKQKENDV